MNVVTFIEFISIYYMWILCVWPTARLSINLCVPCAYLSMESAIKTERKGERKKREGVGGEREREEEGE